MREPLSEEYLRTHTVGELQPLDAPIAVAPYDSEWSRQFEEEACQVREVLGERALRVEHVGSTSVAGFAAKPILDMLLVVDDSADELKYVTALEAAGYRLRIREPEWLEHRMLKGPGREVNLHVFSAGCPEIDRMLKFRDWLRGHESDRELYARCKRALSEREWKYTQNYADAKTAVVEEILARALANRA
jgi:GrpB-like predicted nucleotidyltransferase (UPF0157 family)